MIGLMNNSSFINNINENAKKALSNIKDINKFGLKNSEKDIINNLFSKVDLNNNIIDVDIDVKVDHCIKVIMVNGFFREDLSDTIPDYYNICSLDKSNQEDISKIALSNQHPIIATNSANFNNGIYIESSGYCEVPILLINYFFNNDEKSIVFPRIFIQCNKNSEMKIIEHNISSNTSHLFSNYVTEINCDKDSNLEYYILQNAGKNVSISGNISVDINEKSNVKITSCIFGGKFVKNYIVCNLSGEYSNLTLDGIFLGKNKEYIDNDTIIKHNAPFSTSSEKYKGILDDKSKGGFNGLVYVSRNSHNIDSSQYNNNILLSKDAKINSNPQLEIYCDDVKCAHGSTIGELDEDAILYLRSRGLSLSESRHILLNGFVNEITNKISILSLQSYLISEIRDWMS